MVAAHDIRWTAGCDMDAGIGAVEGRAISQLHHRALPPCTPLVDRRPLLLFLLRLLALLLLLSFLLLLLPLPLPLLLLPLVWRMTGSLHWHLGMLLPLLG